MNLLAQGLTVSQVSRRLTVSRAAIRAWRDDGLLPRRGVCPRCDQASLDERGYAALLGFYLGDGTISAVARCHALRISCDATLPLIVDDVTSLISTVRAGSRVFHVRAPGVVVVQAHWKHWPCLFPQHGPGRKHERPIVLEPWQLTIVDHHPDALLRGLFHSDGSRVANWATRPVGGVVKRYHYPRWQFCNESDDIHRICQHALDIVGVPWRRSSRKHTSVSTRAGVSTLDELIGPKA